MKKLVFIAFIISAIAAVQGILRIDESGAKLKEFYLSLNVENLWIAGQHVNWETGQPDNPDATQNIKTHCSTFAAAACKKLNIYILRPPEHKQTLLANAQYDWLESQEAQNDGWVNIAGNGRYLKAQQYANKGYVVIAICQNPDPHKPGHTALVMPAEISADKLSESGPELIMAGLKNYNRTTLKNGFRHHVTDWPENVIRFYYNSKKPF
jgi:hypothetical protein